MAVKRIRLLVGPMNTTKQEARAAARGELHSPWPPVRLAETDRLETFSDSVLSITITLLVAEIVRPEHASGHLLEKLAEQWASYIAFLASFCYTGVIWLNHRAVFARVRYCDRSLHLANLFLLLTSALIPFPTAILSAAIQSGNEFDARVAVALYAAIAGAMCLSWLVSAPGSVLPCIPSPAWQAGYRHRDWRCSSSWHCRFSTPSPAKV